MADDEIKDIIEVKRLTKKFGKLVAVDDISFSVRQGEIFGFLGPNGAGKTTTISILCTLMRPTKGRVTLNGYNVVKQSNQVRQSVGVQQRTESRSFGLQRFGCLQF